MILQGSDSAKTPFVGLKCQAGYDFSLGMELIEQTGKLTAADKRAQRVWNAAPWGALAGVTLIPPLLFTLLAIILGGTPVWLLAIASIPVSFVLAVIAAVVLLFLRRSWRTGVRERLAADGITADEIDWFLADLSKSEKRALRSMDQDQPLLADAYRETLALRLNATRLASSARRDLLLVERRISRARYLNAPDTTVLLEELNQDRARLEQLKLEGSSRRAEAEARLQMIEAAASRGASWAETSFMLQRLDEGRKNIPLGLETERARQQLREDAERELRKELSP